MNPGRRRLDLYLHELDRRLRLPPTERAELLRELECHVRESVGDELPDAAVEVALDRLGRPEHLVSLYEMEGHLERARRDPTPWRLLAATARWARASLVGVWALTGLVLGDLIAASFLLAALIKPFAPDRSGLWRLPGGEVSLHLGLVAAPRGEELLGWWLVPIGLAGGALALWATTGFGLWCVRRFRRSWLDRPDSAVGRP